MNRFDPAGATPRTDLPFLRRRARPEAAPVKPEISDFIAGKTHRVRPSTHPTTQLPTPPAPAPSQPAPSQPAASQPAASSSLDLSAPSSPATTPSAAPPTGASAASTSLDLSAPTATPSAPPPPSAPAATSARVATRIGAARPTILSTKAPSVTLTRVQSGIGALTIEAACSAQVGDLRLGCAYQFRSGVSSTVQLAGGERFGPRASRRPVVVAGREEFERIVIDLRQCAEVERLAIYAFSESRAQLSWGGTLVASTRSGARVELPIDLPPTAQVAMLLTVYNLDGEFVLRAELEPSESVREACRAWGYDRITWLDDRTPVS